nr:mob kinase activator-like 4 [Quercus suber]
MAARSPASSPRLPSPPPMAEDQLGPTSPGLSLSEDSQSLGKAGLDAGASRRIRPGTKAHVMCEGPPLVDLQEIDSAFPLTEHLKALHYSHTHPADSDILAPITADIARQLAQPPTNTSKEIWLYELGRFLIQKTNAIIVALFADQPSCSAQTCPEMRASEWQYLCAVHDPPKSCSAIDYCCHTLDWAANTLTSSKMFPSRLDLGSVKMGATSDKVLQQQMKEITNIFRRVYRIYAHAWFQHREVFWRVESRTGLYIFFKTVCDEYGMIQAENYTIPPEAEGTELETMRDEETLPVAPPSVLKRDSQENGHGLLPSGVAPLPEPAGNTIMASGDTTKRHRHTMSDRLSSVNTVIQEEAEEDEKPLALPSEDSSTHSTSHGVPEVIPQESDASSSLTEGIIGTEKSDLTEPESTPASEPEGETSTHEDDETEVTVIEVAEEPAPAESTTKPRDDGLEEEEEEKPATNSTGEEAAADAEQATKSVAD